MNIDILENYQNDLIKSRYTPLLIELTNKDLDLFQSSNDLNKSDTKNIAYLLAKKVYDDNITIKKTNILYIDTNSSNENALIEKLMENIIDLDKTVKNLELLKEFVTLGSNILLKNFCIENKYIEKGIDLLIDKNFDATFYKFKNIVINNSKKNTSYKNINLETSNINNKLFITTESFKKIKELLERIKEHSSPAKSIQLIVNILIGIAIDEPKLIFIKDPEKLDRNSLTIISMILSYAKNLKIESEKNIGISFVFLYTNKNNEISYQFKENNEIEKLLHDLSLFAQRYSMLSRPTSKLPDVAVKATKFIGRKKELEELMGSYKFSKENKNIDTFEILCAEPGIGKTKLIIKHLEDIKKLNINENFLQLTLLNQAGHNSTNTGISSLIHSILEETERLYIEKTANELLKYDDLIKGSIDTVYDEIKSLLGIDKVIDFGKLSYNRLNINNIYDSFKSKARNYEDKTTNTRIEQFRKIKESLSLLIDTYKINTPIVLFIDDLQWIDEDSAEFIIKYLSNSFNLHIVASLRPSDANTIIVKNSENYLLNKYKIALLKNVKIFKEELNKNVELGKDIDCDIDISHLKINSTYLKGFDYKTLKELISDLIDGTEEQYEIFTKTIIKCLLLKQTDDIKYETVNTLFAIEMINLFCDEYFYKKNNLNKFIINDNGYKFNNNLEFLSTLNQSFDFLYKEEYKQSFSYYSSSQNTNSVDKYTLASYAVIEERLNILKIYFQEYGNASVNTLLFASLICEPFDSQLVKKILYQLSIAEEEELLPIRNYLNNSKQYFIEDIHYEILEEVYEIVSRYKSFNNSYNYNHNLFEIFLNNKMNYMLDNILGQNNTISKDIFYTKILNVTYDYIKEYDFINSNIYDLIKKDFDLYVYLYEIYFKITNKAFRNNPSLWCFKFVEISNNLSMLYTKQKKYENSMILQKNALEEYNKYCIYKNNDEYFNNQSSLLTNLSLRYRDLGDFDNAVKYAEKSLIINNCQEKNNLNFVRQYIVAILNLSLIYIDFNLNEKAKNLIDDLIIEYQELLTKYINLELDTEMSILLDTFFSNVFYIYSKNNDYKFIINTANKINIIKRKCTKENINLFIEVAYAHLNENYDYKNIETILDEPLKIINTLIDINEELWMEDFIRIYNLLATSYYIGGKILESKNYHEMILLKINKNDKYKENFKFYYEDSIGNLKKFENDEIINKSLEFAKKYESEMFCINDFNENDLLNMIKSYSGANGNDHKIGRNEICPLCDSGKKYKKCCGKNK